MYFELLATIFRHHQMSILKTMKSSAESITNGPVIVNDFDKERTFERPNLLKPPIELLLIEWLRRDKQGQCVLLEI